VLENAFLSQPLVTLRRIADRIGPLVLGDAENYGRMVRFGWLFRVTPPELGFVNGINFPDPRSRQTVGEFRGSVAISPFSHLITGKAKTPGDLARRMLDTLLEELGHFVTGRRKR
jgi:hypothetical protein